MVADRIALQTMIYGWFQKISGLLAEGLCNKDHTILGSILGLSVYANTHVRLHNYQYHFQLYSRYMRLLQPYKEYGTAILVTTELRPKRYGLLFGASSGSLRFASGISLHQCSD